MVEKTEETQEMTEEADGEDSQIVAEETATVAVVDGSVRLKNNKAAIH